MKKKVVSSVLAVTLLAAVFVLPIAHSKLTGLSQEDSHDDVSKAPTAIVEPSKKPEESPKETKNEKSVSVIVELNSDSLADRVIASGGTYRNVPQLTASGEGKSCTDTIRKNQAVVKASIQKLLPDSDFSASRTYSAVMNGFSLQVSEKSIDKIRKINGVKNVFLTETLLYPEAEEAVTQSQNALMNPVSEWDGSGMLIAVIDSEFDIGHEAFSLAPQSVKYQKEQIVAMGMTESAYKSEKVVYAYDYAENDSDTYTDKLPSHGTAVAALAAGRGGAAPEAQLALMKVAGEQTGVSVEVVMAALDDCAKIGADVVNLSLGHDRGADDEDIFGKPFERLQKTGSIVICPAGNSGMNGTAPADIDNGTLNYLACDRHVTAAAASVNPVLLAKVLTADDTAFYYCDVPAQEKDGQLTDIGVQEYCYIADGDYAAAAGKTAVAQREEDIALQLQKAFLADATALVLIDSNAYHDDTVLDHEWIPVALLDDEDSGYFSDYTEGTLQAGDNKVLFDSGSGNPMSDTSSWGVTADLRLKPDITAVGENVYAAVAGGGYACLSGTSVSSAFVSGAYAVLRQYLQTYEWFTVLSPEEQSQTLTAVMMSNAEPVKEYREDGVTYISPRQQGAGRVDLASAVHSGAYLDSPKAELGDSMTGEFACSFRIKNISSFAQTFSLAYYMQEEAEVTFLYEGEPVESLTVEAEGEAEVQMTVRLDGVYALQQSTKYPNGFYVDGYAVLTNEEGMTLNLPFLGFCGDWGAIDPFDNTVYDALPAVTGHDSMLCAADSRGTVEAVALDGNNIFVSRNTVGSYYDIAQLKNTCILPNFYLLRDAYELTVTIRDAGGKQLLKHSFGTVSADRTVPMYQKLLPDSGELSELFAKLEDGNYTYVVSARVMKADGTLSDKVYAKELEFTVDSRTPKEVTSKTYEKDGKVYLELSGKDEQYLRGFQLYTAAYNHAAKKYEYADSLEELKANGYLSENACLLAESRSNPDGSHTFLYDITGLYGELVNLQFMTRESAAPFSAEKIAYKAVDGAYNCTAIKTADAVVYRSMTFVFHDQNGKPAEGVTMQLGDRTAVSDKNGKAVFDRLLPDIDLFVLTSLPQDYHTDETCFLIRLTGNGQQEVLLQFDGEYTSKAEESSQEKSSLPEESSFVPEQEEETDPLYAVALVGTLLLVSAVSLGISRRRRNK